MADNINSKLSATRSKIDSGSLEYYSKFAV